MSSWASSNSSRVWRGDDDTVGNFHRLIPWAADDDSATGVVDDRVVVDPRCRLHDNRLGTVIRIQQVVVHEFAAAVVMKDVVRNTPIGFVLEI